ncbi:uncharacterized protein [Gossypium hirsutum]|uniref:Reverse transcriptase domain-containing protein n=1 Tax=Gossypium hirsutum TaxID=3635 RepID=A0A1U8P7X5_GOSHI|nr:uncharacterized protein LOC107956066 [Gossypium hirsutum]
MVHKDMLELFLAQGEKVNDDDSAIEFDLEIQDKRGAENLAADHLSRLENPHLQEFDEHEINDTFLEEQLFAISNSEEPWIADIANYLAANQVIRRCVTKSEAIKILEHCHSGPNGGHYGGTRTAHKMLESGEKRLMQLNKLDEWRANVYENSRLYKEATKRRHNARLKQHKQFQAGDLIFLYKSRLKLFPGKPKS